MSRLLFGVSLCVHALAAISTAADSPKVATDQNRISAPIVYDGLMLIVSTKDGVAAIVFGEEIKEGVAYRFRYLPKVDGKEQSGKGQVFEKHKRFPGRNPGDTLVVDDGSELFIKSGPVRLEWSRSGAGRGWIYYQPETVTVQIGNAHDFDGIELQRFAR